MRGIKVFAGACALVLVLPLTAFAQAALTGLARDVSGAVLPGVTVEAASPVLIEKVRSAVTDSTGRYTILDLRPGAYRITFTLPGFRTTVREGVELAGTATFTVNADMTVGGVQETITVSGEAPTVNLQTTTRQAVMDQEIVSAIPSSRTPFTTGVLIPGVRRGAFTGQDVGGSVVQEVASLEANGGRTADQRMMVNGVALSSMIQAGGAAARCPNATGTAEFAIDVSGVDAQAATGGVRINFIPRDGGNRFSGTVFGSFAHRELRRRQLHRQRRRRRPACVPPATSSRTGTSIPASAARSSATSSGSSCPGARSTPTTTWRGCSSTRTSNNAEPIRLRALEPAGGPAPGTDHLPGPLTWQVDPEEQDRRDRRPRAVLRVHDRHHRDRSSPEAGNDRRFPAPAVRHRRLEHPGQQQGAARSQRASTASSDGAGWTRRWASWATSTG